MKRWVAAALLLAAAAVLPRLSHPAADVGELEPVAAARISQTPEGVIIRTDTGGEGFGENLQFAVEDLRCRSVRVVFLDSANFLLLENLSEEVWAQLGDYFRPGCYVCRVESEMDLAAAAQYFAVNPPEQTLARLWAEKTLRQTLHWEKGAWSLGGT